MKPVNLKIKKFISATVLFFLLFFSVVNAAFATLGLVITEGTSAKEPAVVSASKSLKLTEQQSKQRIYDINTMLKLSSAEYVNYLDVEKLELHYVKYVQTDSCTSNDCDKHYIACHDVFSRTKKVNSMKQRAPKGLKPLYLDKQVCKKGTVDPHIIRQVN